MLVVSHNIMALNANRMTGLVSRKNQKTTEKLSSGYRINRAADDAAGLAISEKMRRQIRGLTQASSNAQDGISLVQVADGALQEMHSIVQRGNELAVKAANGTLTDAEREMVDAEIQQLKQALNESARITTFNEIKLFPEDGQSPKSIAPSMHYDIEYRIEDGVFTVTGSSDSVQGLAEENSEPGQVLADKIANELVPNAVAQIFASFPSLQAEVGSDSISMALDISYLDGPSNTLAYAQCSFYGTGEPFSFLIKVDSADFTDEDALGTGPNAEMLESTLAHELMHSVMQYTMTDEMTGRAGEEFPNWFVEGTAQLTGGGFTTGWNDTLTYLASFLTDENDNSQDSNIADYLNNYTVAGRPYGHGYLAAAYLGYKANNGGAVTSADIAAGMDKIFTDILQGGSFSDVVNTHTGLTESEIEALFSGGDADLVTFVRKLAYNTGTGAGSVLTTSLNVGGTDILGDSASVQSFTIDPDKINVDVVGGGASGGTGGGTGGVGDGIFLQVGADATAGNRVEVKLYRMDAQALGVEDINVKTQSAASAAIDSFKAAIGSISKVRSYYGALQNRLEHTIMNLDNVVENTTAAESLIRDADMAKEMVAWTAENVLQQAGQAMLAQANRQPEFILRLLQG